MIYRFDFDGDGAADRQGASPTAHFVYEGTGSYLVRVTISDPRWDTETTLEQKVRIH